MKPRPTELVIKCTGSFVDGRMIWADSCDRINWLRTNYLVKISIDNVNWTTLYQDPEDLRFWELSYPHAEMHGGGPPMLECLTDIANAYRQVKSAIHNILYLKRYNITEEKFHPESFGSRYIMWSKQHHHYRLTWDGRENFFRLEDADFVHIIATTTWKDLIAIGYDSEIHSDVYVKSIANQIIDRL